MAVSGLVGESLTNSVYDIASNLLIEQQVLNFSRRIRSMPGRCSSFVTYTRNDPPAADR